MKTLYLNLRALFSGDTVLLVMSSALFLASVANATQWPVLRAFRFCGTCTLLFSVAFGALSGLEVFKPERQKRTIVSAILFLAAVVVCLSQTRIVIGQTD